jgi:hypothetical protein
MTPPTEFKSLALALAYLRRHPDRYIFPIEKGAKFPPKLRDNLDTNCSNDPARIREWSRRFTGCNWGVACKKSGLMVADVDVNPKKNKEGQETYDVLDMLYTWPDTEIVTTPSGGHHHYYVGEHILALGKNGVGADIDFPNYVLIPGCQFADGTSYVGNGAPAVPCPDWIYKVIRNSKASARISNANEIVVEQDQPENVKSAIIFLKEDAEPAIEGRGGEFTTYKVAAYLKDIGISPALTVELMLEHYNPRCEGPWDREGLEKKVANAFNYGNLSKAGGRTAEAEFGDDPPDASFEPMGTYDRATNTYKMVDPSRLEQQRADRKADKDAGIKAPQKTQRVPVIYRATNLSQSVYNGMMAIRADKMHDRIFQHGPDLVRLNQAATKRDLEGEKPTDIRRKRGALMIATIVPDYMMLRLDQAAEFYIRKSPGRPKKDAAKAEKETEDAE